MAGWTYYDLDNVAESKDSVRPWITGDFGDFVFKANALIEDLNSHFVGKGTNVSEIKNSIEKLKQTL